MDIIRMERTVSSVQIAAQDVPTAIIAVDAFPDILDRTVKAHVHKLAEMNVVIRYLGTVLMDVLKDITLKEIIVTTVLSCVLVV